MAACFKEAGYSSLFSKPRRQKVLWAVVAVCILLIALSVPASAAGARSRKLGDSATGKPGHKPGEKLAETVDEHIPFDPDMDEAGHLHRHRHHHKEDDLSAYEADTENDINFDEGGDDFEDDHVDVLQRMQELFPMIDADNSGKISTAEMVAWHTRTATRNAQVRAKREFGTSDLDHNGAVTFKEYWSHDEDAESLDKPDAAIPEWMLPSKKHFEIADRDKSNTLSYEEFFEFLHPEESTEPHMKDALAQEEVSLRDHDEDGKLSLEEFTDTMLYELDGWPPSKDSSAQEATDPHDPDPKVAKSKFTILDTDRSGFLDSKELLPVLFKLRPSEQNYAHDQAVRLMSESDDNRDGELTLAEMENHIASFYHTAYDYEESTHDEL